MRPARSRSAVPRWRAWLREGGLAYWSQVLGLPAGFVEQMQRTIATRAQAGPPPGGKPPHRASSHPAHTDTARGATQL